MDNELNVYEKINFENDENFQFVVLNPTQLDHLDYNKEGYINEVLKTVKFEVIECNKEDFFNKVSNYLNNDSLGSEDSQILKNIVHEEPNFMYEIFYLDIRDQSKVKPEMYNGLATLLNIENNHVWGNSILMKTNLPDNDFNKALFCNISERDIFNILDSRVNTKVVFFEDGEFREEKIYGELDIHLKRFFGDDFYMKEEIGFLSHNLNIYYTLDEYGQKIIPKIVDGHIESAIFFSMKTEKHRGNLSLEELNKMIFLSDKLESYDVTKQDIDLKDELDNLGRKIIKNKFRILDCLYESNRKI